MRLVVCVGVCTVGLVFTASEVRAQGVAAGLKAGVTISKITGSDVTALDPDAGVGPVGGVWVGLPAGPVVRIQPELLVAGRRFSVAGGSVDVSARVIEVPILVAARLRPEARRHPLLYAGPSFGFVSKVTQKDGSTSTDASDQVKDLDVGLTFGGGIEIEARRGAVVLEGRVTTGLRNLSEQPDVRFKSRDLTVLVGYRF